MERTNAQARAGIPMTADQVRAGIAMMERQGTSLVSRKAMAAAAIRRANVTEEGRQVWREYAASL
ncbi:hypothetical protein ACWIGM_09095 [Bosea sp. NPDC055332]